MTTRLIIDADTGSDDAIAIMAAATHPDLELVAVTTVNGNVPLKNTTENTLRVLQHVGSSVPVYSGASRPLVRGDFPVPREVLNSGGSALHSDYLDFRPATTQPQTESAARFLADYYLGANSDTVLVATGPLTNVAAALCADPDLAGRIHRLIVMGGAIGWGNVTPAAEFNFWVDPEAAEVVLSSGIANITIVPLDATHDAPLSLADCDAFDAIGSPAATGTSALLRHRISVYPDAPEAQKETAPVHDALCVAYLIDPSVVTRLERHSVHVETRGERTLGAMIVDTRPWSTEPGNAFVATRADSGRFAEILSEAFAIADSVQSQQ